MEKTEGGDRMIGYNIQRTKSPNWCASCKREALQATGRMPTWKSTPPIDASEYREHRCSLCGWTVARKPDGSATREYITFPGDAAESATEVTDAG
jgi:hypothetical protein